MVGWSGVGLSVSHRTKPIIHAPSLSLSMSHTLSHHYLTHYSHDSTYSHRKFTL